ncbi:MAG: type 4a pilus biogenesis protein PilO [Polyangiaceae bacterium]
MAKLKLGGGGSGLDNMSLPGKLAVGVLFVGLVAAAYLFVFYGEIESDIESTRRSLEVKKTELDKAKEADRAYNKDLTELERRKQLARKQQKILPDDAESPAFLSTVQTVATISGVKLTSWTPQDEEPEAFYAKVPMKLQLEGKFHQVAKFFYGVGQVDRIINMENIDIKINQQSAKQREQELEASRNPLDEDSVTVEVSCLATAFRALKDGEGGGSRKQRGRRR